MDKSTIGIKIADGTFFPVLEEEGTGKKKLVLTTVNDEQESVQIDLYKGDGPELENASYIGSLVIEDIAPAKKGDPEIELILGVDKDGNLNAEAGDSGSEERQSLSVSLESLNEENFAGPNFEIDDSGLDDVPSLDDELSFDDETDLSDIDIDDVSGFDDEQFPEEEDTAPGDISPPDDESAFDDLTFDEEPSFEDESDFEDVSLPGDEPVFDDDLSFDEEPSFDDFENEADDFDDEADNLDNEDDGLKNENEDEQYPDEKRGRRSLAVIVLVILIIAILGLGAFLVIRGLKGDSVPPLEAENTPAVSDPEYARPPEEQPETVVAAEPELPKPEKAPEVLPEKPDTNDVSESVQVKSSPVVVAEPTVSADSGVPSEGHGGGVWYRLKWGDTLWDLSNSFYRTPWLYGLIAVENNIKNPDVIYAGNDIHIPEN